MLRRRVFEHRAKNVESFTSRCGVDRLVWFESYEFRSNAFRRERRIKEWRRTWKVRPIETANPHWIDMYEDLNNLLVL